MEQILLKLNHPYDKLFMNFNEIADKKRSIFHKNSGFLLSYASQEHFKPKSHNQLQHQKISTKPKFQLPLKKTQPKASNKNLPKNSYQIGKLKRVKSFDGLKGEYKENDTETLLQYFDKQNKNLRKHNKYLIEEVRRGKQTQKSMAQDIRNLKQKISKLEDHREELNTREDTHNDTFGENEQCSPIYIQDDLNSENEANYLNTRFKKLIEECSKLKNLKEKAGKREKIAEVAEKMKVIRNRYWNDQ